MSTDDASTAPSLVSVPLLPPELDEEGRAGNSEAARRRIQLREVTAERDELAARLTASQRREIESSIREDHGLPFMHRPGDLFDLVGREVSEFLDEHGEVSRDAVSEALTTLAADRPYLFGQRPPRSIDVLYEVLLRSSGVSPEVDGEFGEQWATVLKKATQ